MKRPGRLSRNDESGSVLVLVLIVVTVTSVLLAAALEFTGTGLTLAPKVKNDRNEANYVQGAVDGAINALRGSTVDGRTDAPDPCPVFDPDPGAGGPSGISGITGNVTVTCEAKAASGASAVPDQPDFAVLALGTGSEGLRQVGGNNLLNINGGVYSHGVISVVAGGGNTRNRMTVTGSAFAHGTCTANRVTTTDTDRLPDCGRGAVLPTGTMLGARPSWESAIPTNSALDSLVALGPGHASTPADADPVPTCSSTTGTVTFLPGYYSERPDVLQSRLAPSCNGSRWNFLPGRYYFDYEGVWDLGTPRAVQVVGGLDNGSALGSPSCTQSGGGVQFVFGGQSRVSVTGSGGIELCSPLHGQTGFASIGQRISVYGVDNAVSAERSGATTPFMATASPTNAGALPFVTPSGARQIGDGSDSTGLALGAGGSAALAYSGFQPVPRGSRVNSLRLRVAHTLTGDATAEVVLRSDSFPSGGNARTFAVPSSCVSPCEIVVPLADIAAAPAWRDINSLRATYTASVGNASGSAGTATVDGVDVVVGHTLPTLRAQTCPSSCSFFNSTVNLNVFIKGTVFTPSAAWVVQVQNASGTIFDRGVVVRDVAVNVSASSTQTTAPFRLPAATPFGRRVLFRGFVGTTEKVRACAVYRDHAPAAGGTTAAPGYGVTVPHWVYLRSASVQNPDCQ